MGINTVTGLIYLVTNNINGKQYVGQTVDLKARKANHISRSKKAKIGFCRAISKYGSNNFNWTILESNILREKLNEREIFWIKQYKTFNNGYNLTLGGNSNTTPDCKSCSFGDLNFDSQTLAAKYFKVSKSQISYWIKMGYNHPPTKDEISSRISKNHADFSGSKNGRAKPVSVNGIEYGYISEAAKALNVQRSTIRAWIKINKNDAQWI